VPIVLFCVGPLYYAFVTSVGSGTQALQPHLFPTSWSLESYVAVFASNRSLEHRQLFGDRGAAVGGACCSGSSRSMRWAACSFVARAAAGELSLRVHVPQIAMLSGFSS
jgi:ABC-type glycerol-3-phosphate transport system permease component